MEWTGTGTGRYEIDLYFCGSSCEEVMPNLCECGGLRMFSQMLPRYVHAAAAFLSCYSPIPSCDFCTPGEPAPLFCREYEYNYNN